jgi:hypothetical protein
LTEQLDQLVASRDDIRIRIVDITRAGTEAERQAEEEFGVSGVPACFVYGKKGELLAEHVSTIEEIRKAVEKGSRN